MRNAPKQAHHDARARDLDGVLSLRSSLSATDPPMAVVVNEDVAAGLQKAGVLVGRLRPPGDAVGWLDGSPVYVRGPNRADDVDDDTAMRTEARDLGVDVADDDDARAVAKKLLARLAEAQR